MIVRLSKLTLLAAVALFMTLVAIGNITDYGSNWQFVQHVLSMDTTFRSPNLMWRAIADPMVQTLAYLLIILVEAASALTLWFGCLRLWARRRDGAGRFNDGKDAAVAGLTLTMLLWGLGFIAIGGEWFAMWQSQDWNGQDAAFRFLAFSGIVLIYLVQPDSALPGPATGAGRAGGG